MSITSSQYEARYEFKEVDIDRSKTTPVKDKSQLSVGAEVIVNMGAINRYAEWLPMKGLLRPKVVSYGYYGRDPRKSDSPLSLLSHKMVMEFFFNRGEMYFIK